MRLNVNDFFICVMALIIFHVQASSTAPIENKKQEKTLIVGSTMDLTRGASDVSRAMQNGIELAFNTESVPGLHIKFIVLDDAYMPNRARENVEKLMDKHNINFLLATVGSSTFVAFEDLIREGTIADLFPWPGVAHARTVENKMKYCIYFRPSYVDEAYAITQHILKTKDPQKIAVFYQNDEFGNACLQGLQDAAEKSSIEIIKLSYARNDVNFSEQVTAVKNANVRFIALFATPLAARQFLGQLGDEKIRTSTFFGVSDLSSDTFKNYALKKGISIIRIHVVPDPLTSTIPLVEEFRTKAKKAEVALDSLSLEGYIVGMILIDVLRRIAPDTSIDSIIDEISRMKNYKLKGYPLNFDEKQQLSHGIWIEDGNGSWIEYSMPTRK